MPAEIYRLFLNGVSCGDEVVIDAGALFSGNFATPLINCPTSPVLVRSASIASLPPGIHSTAIAGEPYADT